MKNRRFLTAADASQSVVSGPGIANVAVGTNNTVIVTAKSSSGSAISTGGDIFTFRITNRCTKYNQYYCKPTGDSGPISANLIGLFGDLNNGNYSIYYYIGSTGAISFQAYLLEQGKVYHEYYSGNFTGSSSSNCLVNGINFSDSNTSNYCLSVSDETSAKIITFIKSPYTGTASFSYSCDLECSIYIEDYKYVTTSSSGTFDMSMMQNFYYSLIIEWYNIGNNYGVSLSWSYPGQSSIAIPSSYIYLPRLVGSSPYNINVVSSVCGDGYRTGSESCDDSDTTSGNGCDSSCSVENGWTCSGGSSSSKDVCTDICGDGKKLSKTSTFCDDGNTSNGDGCDSNCSLETGWTCSGGNSSTKDTCSEICGDGKRYNSNSSYCDDGNTSSGDGCSSSCSKETGFTCSGGSTSSKDTCIEVCGDGKRYSTVSTSCDDGNTLSNDGCNSSCNIEIGWTCSGGSSSTKDTCSEICGDGKRFNSVSTYCDDENTSNGDGCSSSCSKETGWTCSGGNSSVKDSCSEICGDGKRFNYVSTYCDDGNTSNGDGCNSGCSKETGWICSGGNSSTKDTCSEICGDGKRFTVIPSVIFPF